MQTSLEILSEVAMKYGLLSVAVVAVVAVVRQSQLYPVRKRRSRSLDSWRNGLIPKPLGLETSGLLKCIPRSLWQLPTRRIR